MWRLFAPCLIFAASCGEAPTRSSPPLADAGEPDRVHAECINNAPEGEIALRVFSEGCFVAPRRRALFLDWTNRDAWLTTPHVPSTKRRRISRTELQAILDRILRAIPTSRSDDHCFSLWFDVDFAWHCVGDPGTFGSLAWNDMECARPTNGSVLADLIDELAGPAPPLSPDRAR